MAITATKQRSLVKKSTAKKRDKNPIAVAVGKRMRKAREEANLSINDINALKPDWSASRLRNYEQGFSLAGPEEVDFIAEVTHHSCCWIMFGKGPIASQARTLQTIRHQNLVYLVNSIRAEDRFTYNDFLKQVQLTDTQCTAHIDNPAKHIGKRLSQRLERYFQKPKHWLDEQHIESDGLSTSYPPDLQQLMQIHSDLPQQQRALLLTMAKAIADYA